MPEFLHRSSRCPRSTAADGGLLGKRGSNAFARNRSYFCLVGLVQKRLPSVLYRTDRMSGTVTRKMQGERFACPGKALKRLSRNLKLVLLNAGHEIYGQDQPIQNIYFSLSGVMSLVTKAAGNATEVATVGNEGMLGLLILFRTDRIPMRAFAQIPGDARRTD